MLRISQLKLPAGHTREQLREKLIKTLRIREDELLDFQVRKQSLDARKKPELFYVYVIDFQVKNEKALLRRMKNKIQKAEERSYCIPKSGEVPLPYRPTVVGSGPAGLFCAYLLALSGMRPLVLERGGPVQERRKDVDLFWKNGVLDPDSNVQFGEGGAGTFSDGKLTTRINDPLCRYVLDRFAEHGAPAETLRRAKPHIGTDLLRGVVCSMRQEIIRNGGEIRFHACLTGLDIHNGQLRAVEVNGEKLPCSRLILAVGHSARDTFEMLRGAGVPMESKPFSVGVRIEHLQTEINRGLYGEMAESPFLPPGEYQLSHRENGRAVYTFCMCPGGLVVPAASEQGGVVTNGMSEYKRDRDNANAAVAVSVSSEDFGSDPLAGMLFQRKLEQEAFIAAGKNWRAPAADVGSFLDGKAGLKLGRVTPSYALGVEKVDFDRLFPSFVTGMLRTGLRVFDRKLPGFAAADAILTGVETRTSSPVRIPRGEDFQSAVRGLYPCGEGAGYAGGIMSAAVDGLRVAGAIIAGYAE